MAFLYYNNEELDNDWNTLGNWWENSLHTIPAANFPGEADTVYIDGQLSIGPSTPVDLTSIACGSLSNDSFSVDLSNTTALAYTFNGNVNHTGTNVFGIYTFSDNSQNSGTVNSNGDISAMNGFKGNSINNGTVIDNAYFFDNSVNDGICEDNAEFSDSAYNTGTILGDGIFKTFNVIFTNTVEDDVGKGTGTVNGAAYSDELFNYIYNIQYNNNSLDGDIIITFSTIVEFYNGEANNGYINSGDVIFDSGINTGTVITTGRTATFNNDSSNTGTLSGNAIFNDNSINAGTLSGSATFNDSSSNTGTLSGSATFNENSGNSGTVTNATFNGSSENSGTVTNATFKNVSVNTGNVTGNAYFDSNTVKEMIRNSSTGTVTGTVLFPFADILGTGLQ